MKGPRMKRSTALFALAALFAIGVAIPYSVLALQKDTAEESRHSGKPHDGYDVVCSCPAEQWGEDEEEPYNEYWLCLNCDEQYYTSEVLPDGTAAVVCGAAEECAGCLSIITFRPGKREGKKPAAF